MRKLLWVLGFTLPWASPWISHGYADLAGGGMPGPGATGVPLEQLGLPGKESWGGMETTGCLLCSLQMRGVRPPKEQNLYDRASSSIQNADYESFSRVINNKDGIRIDPNEMGGGFSFQPLISEAVSKYLNANILEESYRENPGTLTQEQANAAADESARQQRELQKIIKRMSDFEKKTPLKLGEGILERLDFFLETHPDSEFLTKIRERAALNGEADSSDARESADVASAVEISTQMGSAKAIDSEMKATRLKEGVIRTCNTEYLRYLIGQELKKMRNTERSSPPMVPRLLQKAQAREGGNFCSFLANYSTRKDQRGHVYFTGSIELSDETTGQKELLPDSVELPLIEGAGGVSPATTQKAQ